MAAYYSNLLASNHLLTIKTIMATRALLLCGDEKAVHAISQILDELEVSFEHSSEPAFALKRLPAQRFDLLIVDCDNAQNATQVFNSARASNLNKNSIAVAIVEGKAGVPNAFRLGASLVLTKPVSLEQARNTLRTGIGMTKKDSEVKPAASAPVASHAPSPAVPAPLTPASLTPAPLNPPVVASTPHAPAPAPSASTPLTPHPVVASPLPPAPVAKIPAAPLVPVTPAAAVTTTSVSLKPVGAAAPTEAKPAPAAQVEKPVIALKAPTSGPAPVQEAKPAVTNTADSKVIDAKTQPSLGVTAVAKAATAAADTAATATLGPSGTTSTGKTEIVSSNSALTVPDKKVSDEAKKPSELSNAKTPVLKIEDPLAEEPDALDPLKDHGVPLFGGMGKEPFAGLESDKPARSKAPLVAALVLILLGGGTYGAWMTQPNFRALMVWEYGNVMTKIDALRGKTPVSASEKLQAAPVPAIPAQPAAPAANQSSESIDVAMPPNTAANDTTSGLTNSATPPTATGPTDAAATNSSTTSAANNVPTKTAPAATTPATAAKTEATKPATLQTAKQDSTPGKTGPKAALVPASLPPTTTAKAPASDLLEVSEDFADDQVIHRVHPTYPKQALTRKLHGSVVLQVIVSKQGKVDSLALISGDPLLGQAAQSAVKQWRYKPYWHNGEPTDFQTRVTVDFKLP